MREPLELGRSWALGALFIIGLLVAGLVVELSDLSLSNLNIIHADAARRYSIGGSYLPGWDSGLFNPFVEGKLQGFTVFSTIIYIVAVTAIGRPIVKEIPRVDEWPTAVRVLAGFLPGYLMVLAPLQIVLSLFPIPAGPILGMVGVVLTGFAMNRRQIVAFLTDPTKVADLSRLLPTLGTATLVMAIVSLSALHRLQAGRNFMVPDSGTSLLRAAEWQLGASPPGRYIMHWDQHSDEWVFNAPLMFASQVAQDYLFPLWTTESMALASFACLLFGLTYSLSWRRRVLCAALVTATVLLATSVIDPRYYTSLFGGQNPSVWLGHPGRYLAIVAPWFVLTLAGGLTHRVKVAVVLALLGLGFVNVQVAMYVAATAGGLLFWRVLAGRKDGFMHSRWVRIVVHGTLGFAVLGPLIVFSLLRHVPNPSDLGYLLLIFALLVIAASAIVTLATWRSRVVPDPDASIRPEMKFPWSRFWRGGLYACALIGGFLLSGNLVSDAFGGIQHNLLGIVLPGYDGHIVSRGVLEVGTEGGLSFPSFAGEECRITGHCSGAGFLAVYGLFTIFAAAAWIVLGRLTQDETINQRRVVWCWAVLAFIISFALVDFTGASIVGAWIMTRFIEVPYYGLLAFAVVTLVGSRSRVTAGIAVAVAVTWVVVPTVVNSLPGQLWDNLNYIFQVIQGTVR